MTLDPNIFKVTVDSQYVEDFKLNFFNSKKRDPYTGYIFNVFVAREDWEEIGLVLSIKFIKMEDVEEFLQIYEQLPGTKIEREKSLLKGRKHE